MTHTQPTIAEIQELLATIQGNPTLEDKAVLRSAASMLLEIAAGRPLAAIEGESYRAGLDGKDQPNFDPR
jgi:hypothetical protein